MNNFKLFGNEVTVDRINNDVNGNPRYVLHFTNVSHELKVQLGETVKDFDMYVMSLAAAGRGFKKYHNKQYGGGICFQSYNVQSDLDYLESNVQAFIAKKLKSSKGV